MKNPISFWLTVIFGVACAVYVGLSGRVPQDKGGEFPERSFGRLPVVSNGRIQPLDSLARNALLQLRQKQTCNAEPWKGELGKPKILSASAWLMEMFFDQELADTRPVFRIDHPDLKGLLGVPLEADPEKLTDGKHYSWVQVRVKMEDLQTEARRVGAIDNSSRTSFDSAVMKLWQGVILYMRLQNAVQPQNAKNWEKELREFVANAPAARLAAKAEQAQQPYDKEPLERIYSVLQRAERMSEMDPPLVVAPYKEEKGELVWKRTGDALFDIVRGEEVPTSVRYYAGMGTAFRAKDATGFGGLVKSYADELEARYPVAIADAKQEQKFNFLEPFYKSCVLYVFAGILLLGYMLLPERLGTVRNIAEALIWVAFATHTLGLIFRIFVQDRPPVTNLYSSAVFIGWGACVLGLGLEQFWRKGLGLSVASIIGFVTLIIAHHLSLDGDTMEMMRAVLDTNFWLATHVVVVTLGYSATFVAGILAMLYILLGLSRSGLPKETASILSRMVYAVICFATLFSFVGTVLGGIWADQSWGRFWGWDVKENGALMIVLWNAVFLHARWGGIAKERGLMAMAIGGNIITAWSWFGVNMLGVGLHSYGFMSAGAFWLKLFVLSQAVLIALAYSRAWVWLFRLVISSK